MPIINRLVGQSATIKQTQLPLEDVLIKLDNIRFSYDGVSTALDGVTLHIERGEYVCIVGANGSGKSTLAKHINALLSPEEGSVAIDGIEPSDERSRFEVRKMAAMVFQNPDDALVASIVEDEVAFGPSNLGIEPAELSERIRESLRFVGLAGFQKRAVSSLSGGQKQRLALASALAMSPSILILDEATAMLDPAGRASVLTLARSLHSQGMTIVAITQSMDEALEADRLVVMEGGRIVADEKPNEILLHADWLSELGLEPPRTARLSSLIRQHGLPIPATCDEYELKEALCNLHAAI